MGKWSEWAEREREKVEERVERERAGGVSGARERVGSESGARESVWGKKVDERGVRGQERESGKWGERE